MRKWWWRNWLRILLFAALAAAIFFGGLDGIVQYRRQILHLLPQHIGLIVFSSVPAILFGLALGVLLSRPSLRRIAEPIIQVLNIGATIPTLAILALAMMWLGIGRAPALFALFLHALLPIVRNTYQGILGVPPHLLETARGMGMRAAQQLLWVEFPNALLTILTGIRVALVINVGIAPLAFLVGGGGLGDLIFSGIDLFEPKMMLAGAIPTALLAVLVDFAMTRLIAAIIPRGVLRPMDLALRSA